MKKIVFCLFCQLMFFNMVNADCLHSNTITISSCSATDASGNSTNFTCTYNRNKKIEGLAVCSSTPGNGSATVTTSSISVYQNDDAKYCWCKIIHPINTYWVQVYVHSDAGNCQKECVTKCTSSLYKSYIQHIINNTLNGLTMPNMID